jgi:CubicO group peptidase (beta-lactamase class C family)
MEKLKTNFRKNTMTLLSLFLISVFSCSMMSCSKSDDNTPDEEDPKPIEQLDIAVIDTKVEQWLTENNMPGISLAISKNGKLVYSKGYGYANSESKTAVTPETQFRIASVSKLITSAAVMKLVQDGKVQMDQKVFGTTGILGTTYGTQPYKTYVTDVTVSDLLHHICGGWGQDNDPAFFDVGMDATAVINYTLNNISLTKAPGTSFAYSNFGYMLLEKIIEKASGKPYVQYVNDEIWNKVGAKQSAIAGSKLTDKLPKEANYYGQGDDIPYVYGMNLPRGAGAMGWLSTPNDLLRFATAVDSSATRPDILSLQTIKTMTTPTAASIGFGWHFGCGWVVEGPEWFWWGTLAGTFAILYRNSNGICVAAAANSRYPILLPPMKASLGRI